MRRVPHLLRVEGSATDFAPLFAAAKEAGLRLGWLTLHPPSDLPSDLEAAAALGALRAVAVGGGRSLALKPMRGEPVLHDVLREHFRGCAAVLVDGDVEAPRLRAEGDGWRVESTPSRLLAADRWVAVLRRPRPWDD